MDHDPAMIARIGSMLHAADSLVADDILRRLGRHLMYRTPLVEGMGPWRDPADCPELTPDPEIDGPLMLSAPNHRFFEDEPDRLELFREAWGEGFDEIIFASGEADDVYAEQLVEAFIAFARKHELAISTPTDMDDDQFNTWLRDDFVGYIREWRKQVLDLLTGGEAE